MGNAARHAVLDGPLISAQGAGASSPRSFVEHGVFYDPRER